MSQLEFLYGISHSGDVELVGINELVAQNNFGASVEVAIDRAPSTGSIFMITLRSVAGTPLTPNSNLYIFSADPGVALNDSALDAPAPSVFLAVVPIVSTDWVGPVGFKAATKQVEIPFHRVPSLFFVFQNIDATSFNAAGGNDELYSFEFWYQLLG